MRTSENHIQKIVDLKKAMTEKIPKLLQEIRDVASNPSVGLLDQRYSQVCREVAQNLNKLNVILLHLDPEKEVHYKMIVQIALYLINNASINLVFSHDNRQSILKEKHWASVSEFGRFISPVVYTPEVVQQLLSPSVTKSLDFQ